jgi:hypothetical protein
MHIGVSSCYGNGSATTNSRCNAVEADLMFVNKVGEVAAVHYSIFNCLF